jgi:diacylglycerol kinase (ATP)
VRAQLVVNPRSRRGARLGQRVRSELRSLGIELDESPHATELDAIVIAGGDGTLARQIPHALALGIPVGIVPLGTFNDLARALSIPLDVEGACAVIAAGRMRAIDVAVVNGTYYVTEASIGISSRLARRQRPRDKQRFGLLAILASLVLTARHSRPFRAQVTFNGTRETFKAVQLTVANSASFGGFITVEDAAIDDGWLDLFAVEIENVVQLFSVAAAIVAGKRRSAQGLRTFRARAFDVWTRRSHRISADGEPAGKTPARFEVLPSALNVLVP